MGEPTKSKGGRPRKEVDAALIERMAAIHCTLDEMASITGVSVDTLGRRFAEPIKRGRARGKRSLRRHQYKLAKSGNATMLIWLGKQLLEQRDKLEHSGDVDRPLIPVQVFQAWLTNSGPSRN